MEKVTLVQKVVIKHPQENKQFLLLIRNKSDKSRPGDYDIPGGSVKEGELHEEALKREVLEETGLEIEDIKPILVKSNYDNETKKYFIYIGYCAIAKDTRVKLNPLEHESFEWQTLVVFKKSVKDHILLNQIEAAYAGH